MTNIKTVILLILLIVLLPVSANAYIGPGMGAGALATVFGVITSLFLAIVAVIYYPIKRLIKKHKSSTPIGEEE
ncbi:hypothetical protein ACFLZ5_00905 [Thermodesulfobacteriota bacterium]